MPTPEELAQLVFHVRGEKVMFDADLAKLYGVTTKALNQAMTRNKARFPEDFAFRLTRIELETLRSQIVTTSSRPGKMWSQIVTTSQKRRRTDAPPYAFTEQGVAMLSSVLRSPRAVEVNIAIMRTFVQLRRLMDSNRDLRRQIEALENERAGAARLGGNAARVAGASVGSVRDQKKYDEKHRVPGGGWVDCIGRMVRRPSEWEVASQFAVVFAAIKQLVAPPVAPRKQIGFHP